MGIGSAFAFPAAGAVAKMLGRRYGMGYVKGQFNMGMNVGGIAGALLAGWIMDLFGINYVFLGSGVIGIYGSIFCGISMRKQPHNNM
ncbi:hypothetical protein JW835_13055 [bacterium]|nr:hypothetical protein [bacterium]